ncbi:MAG TPA: DNA primase [Candidatus Thiothrix moscowensis]|uniref:DNA primase n=1 Tax=unclassified Thiothrix TaxID=2636184 RepID=UPI002601000E|nr:MULTISPECIES: DNA primase [unclassified Thiothrix]HRJ52583.1 DNA primase [Candidatus Thiothrix moscowensis]HRJ94273.1 DNA primase [Candidatus Thiothrix moscowensis]
MNTAGRIPKEFIDQLLNRVDIVDVVGSRVPLKKAGREYMACCPFHNEKTPSFTVSPTKQFYHCFGCGVHGSAISFLMEYEHLEYVEAIEALARTVGVQVPREGADDAPKRKRSDGSLYHLLEDAAVWFQGQLKQTSTALEYLQQRGLSADIITRFGLGYAPAAISLGRQLAHYGEEKLIASGMSIRNDAGRVYDRFRERVMFPIRDRRGRVIGFGGRIMGEGSPKYLNSPETEVFHKGAELYGLFEARQHTRKLERLLVVEGYMDVIALAQYGVTYAVATLGTATTPEHIKQLLRLVPEVVFCFDGDRAGREAAWRALENALPELRDDKEIRFLFLPQGEDPDTQIRQVGQEAFEASFASALTLSAYLSSVLQERYNISTREGKSHLLSEGLKLLATMPVILLREQLLGELSTLTNTPLEVARRHLRGNAPVSAEVTYNRSRLGDQDVRRTPARHAIALLLHYPVLVELAGSAEQILEYDLPGMNLLAAVVENIDEHPHIHTAGLLERFRQTEHEQVLMRLSSWRPETDDEAVIRREFSDCLQQIRRQANQQRLEALLHRERTEGLSVQERHDLLCLLSELHNLGV